MTAEERTQLKRLIDARRRELVDDEGRKYYNRDDCVACGCPLHRYTPGCRRCRDRELKLLRRRGVYAGRRCGGCGATVDVVTAGCEPCARRQRRRASRERRKMAA